MSPDRRADDFAKPRTRAPGDRAVGALGIVRKLVVMVAGVTVLAIGIALIVLPGPAVLVIPAGLAILATEFPWAQRLLRFAKERASSVLERARRSPVFTGTWRRARATRPGRGMTTD